MLLLIGYISNIDVVQCVIYIFTDHHAPVCEKPLDLSLHAKIHRHVPKLITIIELDYGLLDEILSKGILDDVQIANIRTGANIYEQINRLLSYFQGKSDDVCQQFVTALSNTHQSHVVNYVEYDGGQ